MKISELSLEDRKWMVSDISFCMWYYYHIDQDSVDKFWKTVGIGIEVNKRA